MRYPLTKIKVNDICAEVGVWKGNFSSRILERNPKALHLIDPWVSQDYTGRWYSCPQQKMDKIYQRVVNKFKEDDRVIIHRNFSTEPPFPARFFDWVYIDGNHSYPAVLKDLEFYSRHVKRGGFLCGDDYGWTDKSCTKGPKVAVDEFTTKYNLPLEVKRNQFIIST